MNKRRRCGYEINFYYHINSFGNMFFLRGWQPQPIQSFCRGSRGTVFSKRVPLAAGGKSYAFAGGFIGSFKIATAPFPGGELFLRVILPL